MSYQIINGYGNIDVVSFYLSIIFSSLKKRGDEVEYISNYRMADKKKTIIVAHSLTAAKLLLKGYKNIVLWQQGIAPEESFLRNKSQLRRALFYRIERFVFKRVKKIIFVSKKMKEIYEEKFRRDFGNNSFVMPCFSANSSLNEINPKKYESNTFAYVGSTAKWQCFEETVQLFKMIKNKINDATLDIYTFDVETAIKITNKYGVVANHIERLTNDELSKRMKTIKYGFVIRKDNLVNNVATPTKLSTYLSSGVIPIFTQSICDFASLSSNMEYVVRISNEFDDKPIIEMCNKKIDFLKLKEEYSFVFDTYYSRTKYIEELSLFL